MPHAAALETLGFIRKAQLMELWGIGLTAVDSQIQAGLLPKPVLVSERLKGWPPAEIAAIRTARIAGRSLEEIRQLVRQLEAARTETAA